MTIKEAYEIVLDDIINNGDDLFVGKCDIKSNDVYMSGIALVMAWIAYRVSDETGNNFSRNFIKNLVKSRKSIDN